MEERMNSISFSDTSIRQQGIMNLISLEISSDDHIGLIVDDDSDIGLL